MSESVEFRSRDDLMLQGTLQGDLRSPVAAVLFVHGITSEQHESGFYTQVADLLASSSIASLRFSWRCHGGNKLPVRELTLFGIVNDIHSAWRYLCSRTNIASTNLFVVAASFGGGASIYWAVNQTSAQVKRAILLAPVIDYGADLFRKGEIDSDFFLRNSEIHQLETEGTIPTSSLPVGRGLINELPFFDCATPFTKATFPITVFHGGADSDVPLASSRKYVSQNPLAELQVIPDVDHGFIVPGSEFTDPVNDSTHTRVSSDIHTTILTSLD